MNKKKEQQTQNWLPLFETSFKAVLKNKNTKKD
jgi:hypothetical protein